jgi:hypothetical protein
VQGWERGSGRAAWSYSGISDRDFGVICNIVIRLRAPWDDRSRNVANALKGTGFFSDAGLLRKCIRVNANREGACLEPAAIDLAQNAADGQPRIGVDDAIRLAENLQRRSR